MKPKLKIAVVGLGRIGWGFHLMQSHRSLDFELTAAVDPLPLVPATWIVLSFLCGSPMRDRRPSTLLRRKEV